MAPISNSKENNGFGSHTVLEMKAQMLQLLGRLTQEFFRLFSVPFTTESGQMHHLPNKETFMTSIVASSVDHSGMRALFEE